MVTQQKSQFASEISDAEWASRMVIRVEGILSRREGLNVEDVRPRVARHLKVVPRTILNVRNKRRKIIGWSFMEGLRSLLIDTLQSELARLQHEINIERQISGGHRSDVLDAAEAQVEAVWKTLRDAAR